MVVFLASRRDLKLCPRSWHSMGLLSLWSQEHHICVLENVLQGASGAKIWRWAPFLEIKEKQTSMRIKWYKLSPQVFTRRDEECRLYLGPTPSSLSFCCSCKDYAPELFIFSLVLCQAPQLQWPGSFLLYPGWRKVPCNHGRLRNRANSNTVISWGAGP